MTSIVNERSARAPVVNVAPSQERRPSSYPEPPRHREMRSSIQLTTSKSTARPARHVNAPPNSHSFTICALSSRLASSPVPDDLVADRLRRLDSRSLHALLHGEKYSS
jgi:hypothetical protein